MRVPHYAMRPLAALALAGLMTGCGGGDNNAPDAPFDPAGTTSDLGAIEASFNSDAMAAFQSAAPAIGSLMGETPAAMALRAAPSKALGGGKAGVREYAGAIARVYSAPAGGMRPYAPQAAILDEHLGVTFTRNPETLEYEASGRSGAPSNGVRIIVYTVNPISGEPVSPLQEVGYADVEVTEGTNGGTVRIELVSDGVTYLDYAVGATVSETRVTITVAGFVSNGQDRVNFDLDTQLTESALAFDYSLIVPTRGNFRMDFEEVVTDATMTSTLELRGPHGTVTIEGSRTQTTGSYDVEVNGEAFATISVEQGSAPVITGADGEALTEEELATLQDVFVMFLGGFDFFEDLLDPIG
jgi:hypothetical protein